MKEAWVDEHVRWRDRDLSAKRYVYVWADGIYVQARLEDDAQCLLVIIGATAEGKKELVGLADGIRESTQSWKELLLDLKRRGLAMAPQLARWLRFGEFIRQSRMSALGRFCCSDSVAVMRFTLRLSDHRPKPALADRSQPRRKTVKGTDLVLRRHR